MRKFVFVTLIILSNLKSFSQNNGLVFNPQFKPFYHGVASGDPLHDRVIIWTRVTPDSGFATIANVDWRVALDTGMINIVQYGTTTTDQSMDFTVKVDVTGLTPNTYYYYEFTYNNMHSIRGRTRTAPLAMQDSLRFGIVSCSNYEAGYFNVYRVLKERNDVDAIIHLGDYIYEYEHNGYAYNSSVGRTFAPSTEIIALSDYRTRYSCYKLDEDLIRLHQQYPFIIVWDDHESANDSWMNGADNHSSSEGSWVDRKAASQQAFMEWLPIRPKSQGNFTEIYRKIQFGPLMDLLMLDTRLIGREEQAGTTGSTVTNQNRTLLGTAQYNWLLSNLNSTATQWKIIGQQVMMAPLKVAGIGVNDDQWDGYPAERTKIISHVMTNDIKNIVVLTGDIHCSWANDIPTANYQSNGNGSAFVEMVTPAVTSPAFPINVGVNIIKAANNHIKWVDLSSRGFIIFTVTQARAQGDWFFVSTINSKSSAFNHASSWYVNAGERNLKNSQSIMPTRHDMDKIPAPDWQRQFIHPVDTTPVDTTPVDSNISIIQHDMAVVGVFPNPFSTGISVQLYVPIDMDIQLVLFDLQGKEIALKEYQQQQKGLHFLAMEMAYIPNGIYVLQIRTKFGIKAVKLIKE